MFEPEQDKGQLVHGGSAFGPLQNGTYTCRLLWPVLACAIHCASPAVLTPPGATLSSPIRNCFPLRSICLREGWTKCANASAPATSKPTSMPPTSCTSSSVRCEPSSLSTLSPLSTPAVPAFASGTRRLFHLRKRGWQDGYPSSFGLESSRPAAPWRTLFDAYDASSLSVFLNFGNSIK